MRAPKLYGDQALAALLEFDWSRLGSWHERRDTGVWVLPLGSRGGWDLEPAELEVRVSHPTANLDSPALPFPFTLRQFIAFCNATPMLAWDCVEAVFTNDDGGPDLHALDGLRRISEPAHELVQGFLFGRAAPGELDDHTELPQERQRRRLRQLRALGADFEQMRDGWRLTGARGAMASLVRQEQSARRPRSDRKDVRSDLIAARKEELGS